MSAGPGRPVQQMRRAATGTGIKTEEHAERAQAALEALGGVAGQPVVSLAVGAIDTDVPWNPRGLVSENSYLPERLETMVLSVRNYGVLQPLLVRKHPDQPGRFQLIAGFRRYHGALLASLLVVPVRVLDVSDDVAASIAIIENTERENLENIDETFSVFSRLSAATGLSASEVARAMKSVLNGGEDRHQVAALLAELSPLGLAAWANRRAKVLSMNEHELDAVRRRRIPVTVAEQLIRLGEREERASLLERALNEGWTEKEAQQEVNLLTAKVRKPDEDRLLVQQTVSRLKPAVLKRIDPDRRRQAMDLIRQLNTLLGE